MLITSIVNHRKPSLVKMPVTKNYIVKESEYCSKVIVTKFNKTLVMTKRYYEECKNSTKCAICLWKKWSDGKLS